MFEVSGGGGAEDSWQGSSRAESQVPDGAEQSAEGTRTQLSPDPRLLMEFSGNPGGIEGWHVRQALMHDLCRTWHLRIVTLNEGSKVQSFFTGPLVSLSTTSKCCKFPKIRSGSHTETSTIKQMDRSTWRFPWSWDCPTRNSPCVFLGYGGKQTNHTHFSALVGQCGGCSALIQEYRWSIM